MRAMRLYCVDGSPPVRAVYLCLEALGLQPQRHVVHVIKGEQLAPQFKKINPQHSVPTLDDNGFILWDSHAINTYLVSKYGKDDSLYPQDLQKRAIIHRMLHFDSGILFPRLQNIFVPLFFQGCKEIGEEKRGKVIEAYVLMEIFLRERDFVTGNNYTIADFSCVSSISTLVEGVGITADNHPRVAAWLQRCKETLPGYSAAQDRGLHLFKGSVDRALNPNKIFHQIIK